MSKYMEIIHIMEIFQNNFGYIPFFVFLNNDVPNLYIN